MKSKPEKIRQQILEYEEDIKKLKRWRKKEIDNLHNLGYKLINGKLEPLSSDDMLDDKMGHYGC